MNGTGAKHGLVQSGRGSARRWIVVLTLALCASLALATDPPGTITTVAGGGIGDGGSAISALLNRPWGVAADASGNLFVAEFENHRIRRVSADGTITTVAGTGASGFSGDGGPATSASLFYPMGVAVDPSGNLFVADWGNSRIRKIAWNGTMTTVAGGGTVLGDGGPATAASLGDVRGVAVDGLGSLFIAEWNNNRIRKVAPDGTITTVAGTGASGYSGDGGPATSASLREPAGVAVDASGNLFIADSGNSRVRKVASGTITTVATVRANGVAVDASGNLLIADTSSSRIRKVAPDGTVTTVAGTGAYGFSGDDGPATSATFRSPTGVAADASGSVFVADYGNHRIRKVSADGTITTHAGTGSTTFSGDGGPATSATLFVPSGVAVDASGDLFVADYGNHRIRKIAPNGTITTVVGTGAPGFLGDGGPAISASLRFPSGVAVDASGNLFIADQYNYCVRKVTPDGTITTVAGGGWVLGDGGPATAARLQKPAGVAVDATGNLLIADLENNRIRKVSADGTITTVAGGGTVLGDGGPATSAMLSYPSSVAVDALGSFYIGEQYGGRVRKVSPSGTITTVAGTGTYGFSGDGGPATLASISNPLGLAMDAAGNLLIADSSNNRIRKVSADGTITTVVGGSAYGFSGDGGPALSAKLNYPNGIALDAGGSLFIADVYNHRIRKVAAASPSRVVAPAAIARECNSEAGATVDFVFDVTPGPADLLRVRDVSGGRTLLEVVSPLAQQYGVGPVEFPHGASTVVIELLQGATAVASATVVVQIEDTVAPVLTGCEPRTIELEEPMTPLSAEPLGITVSDACDPSPTLGFAPASVPLGTTTVTAAARDATGNETSCMFDVMVVDTTPPSFTVMTTDLVAECTGGAAWVAFDVAATDLSGAVTIACTDETGRTVDPAGTTFEDGVHTVTCVASDASGNEATWTFTITVRDTTAPVIVCPEDITAPNEPGESFAYVAFAVTATDACDPSVPISTTAPWGPVASGDAFPVGLTEVACSARDTAGNEATCTFRILVRDVEPPVIACPETAVVYTDAAGSLRAIAPADLGATATDNCFGPIAFFCTPNIVSPGTTGVVLTARDGDGNESTCDVSVTVLRQGEVLTPAGSPVTVTPQAVLPSGSQAPVEITFDQVTAGGITSVMTAPTGPPAPHGFKLGTPPVYYDVTTTVQFTGTIELCFTWVEGQIANERNVRLFHQEGGRWIDVTTSVDTTTNIICGRVSSLSPFIVAEIEYAFEGLLAPLNADGSSLFKAGRTVPLKFRIRGPSGEIVSDATARVRTWRVSSSVTGTVEEEIAADSAGESNEADLFRFDPDTGQYIFNLQTKGWSKGTYRAEARLDDGSVHGAAFSVRE